MGNGIEIIIPHFLYDRAFMIIASIFPRFSTPILMLFFLCGLKYVNVVAADANTKKSNFFYINGIRALVFGNNETHVVTALDINRPAIFEGRFLSEKEYITRILIFEDSRNYKIPVDDDTVDKYLMGIQKEHGLSIDDIKRMFKEAGYTYGDGRTALKMLYTNNALLGFKINDRLIVAEQAVLAYHKEHPEIIEPAYLLEIATIYIPQDELKESLKSKLQEAAHRQQSDQFIIWGNDLNDRARWNKPFWINESELAEDKQKIPFLKVGEVFIQETESGFDIFRLKEKKEKHVRPIDNQRYQEIVDILRQPLYTTLREEYDQEVWKKFPVMYPQHSATTASFNAIGL